MSVYRDAVLGIVDTTGASTPQTNSSTVPTPDATNAPNSLNSIVKNVQITAGGGQTYFATMSNPA